MKKYSPYIVTTILFTITIYALRPKVQEPVAQKIETPKLQATAPATATTTAASAAREVTSVNTVHAAPVPLVDGNQVHYFLNGSQTIKHLVSTNIPELVAEAKKIIVPEGIIVRHMEKPGLEYREMKVEGGVTVKKLISNGKPISETYFDKQNAMSFQRKFNKEGQLANLSLRWSRREAVILDFYKDGQLAAVIENVEGKSTEQRWDVNHNLIRHQTTGFFNGKAQVVNHMSAEPTEEEDAADDTESL